MLEVPAVWVGAVKNKAQLTPECGWAKLSTARAAYFFLAGAADFGAESFFFWLAAPACFCFCSFCLFTDFGDLSPIRGGSSGGFR